MKTNLLIIKFVGVVLIAFTISCQNNSQQKDKNSVDKPGYAIVIHGGAGNITREYIPEDLAKQYRSVLDTALNIGVAILKNGGKSIDAVEQTIRYMEDCPLFNSGRGAVFTNEEKNELDASIMVGSDQTAGAVGGVTIVKHPISAARKVMEETRHVMLVGKGAEEFSKHVGLEIVDPDYFFTQRRYESLQRAKKKDLGFDKGSRDDYKFGTVGCVALDANGDIVAGTSTGGMTNKKYNRIGDSPIIGAGTYADNSTCGISSTGHGEFFIRYAVAHDIAARMEYKNISLAKAAEEVVMKKLVDKGGKGGIIGLDALGNISMVYNSAGMIRAYDKDGERVISLFESE